MSPAPTCPECNGSGELWDDQDNVEECPVCGGTGEEDDEG